MIWAMNVGKLRSLKKKSCVWVPIDLCFSCPPSFFTYYIFFSWWARTCWFIVNTGVLNNLLNKAGCWVNCSLSTGFPNRDNLFVVWKSCPPTFRKRQLLSLTWVSFPFISCLFYCFTLFLIFNKDTFFGVACTSLFNTFKLQPRVVETRL